MDTNPAIPARRGIQYTAKQPRKRFKVQESRCPSCLGSGTDSRTRLPGGILWVQPCAFCSGAGVVEKTVERP